MSKQWDVILSPESKQEMRDIKSYIANVLLVPETAEKQVDRILDVILNLDELPMRFPHYPKEPWQSRGLRYFTVDNYNVYYLINESTKEVVILHVFYGGRNIDECLVKSKEW